MINTIQAFFARVRFWWFTHKIEKEIYFRLFPHLTGKADYGYPFNTDEEVIKFCQDCNLGEHPLIKETSRMIDQMPEGFGVAFRYILHNEIRKNPNMSEGHGKMFKMLAIQRIYPGECDPRYIATRAT